MAFGWDDAAGVALNTGLGLLLEGHNDQRQIRQQQKLTDMQIAAQKNLSNYSYDKQYEMWLKTGPKGQMEQYKAAGLNPALMYGMGGGGGVTTGGAPSTSVGSGQAPSGGGEMMGLMLARAQMGLMQAQTEKTLAEAEKTKGVDTQVGQSQIKLMAEQTNNEFLKGRILTVDKDIQETELTLKQETLADSIDTVKYNLRHLQVSLEKLTTEKDITQETKSAIISEVKQRAIGALLQNALTKAQIVKTDAEVKTMAATIAQGNVKLGIEKFKSTIEANNPSLWNVIGGELQNVLDEIYKLGTDTRIRRQMEPSGNVTNEGN